MMGFSRFWDHVAWRLDQRRGGRLLDSDAGPRVHHVAHPGSQAIRAQVDGEVEADRLADLRLDEGRGEL